MTTKQVQCLLLYLGYDVVGTPDGIYGDNTRAATRAFQKEFGGLSVDGVAGTQTYAALRQAVADGWQRPKAEPTQTTTASGEWVSKYFTREEFRCQCGGKYCNGFPAEPNPELLGKLDLIREELGVPITIVESGGSGIRCPTHNANVGGVANSEHLYGNAADLHSSASPTRMKQAAEKVLGNTGGIGLYSWGIHVDVGKYSRWNG